MSIDIAATRARVIALPGSTGVDIALGLLAEIERLRKDARDAETGAAACDQIVAVLDGFPVNDPCPEAARVVALVAEIERLRAEVHELRMMVEEAARAENANAEDAKRERAAVVAWLRKRHADTQESDGFEDMYDNAVSCTYRRAADAIERGEHRREE